MCTIFSQILLELHCNEQSSVEWGWKWGWWGVQASNSIKSCWDKWDRHSPLLIKMADMLVTLGKVDGVLRWWNCWLSSQEVGHSIIKDDTISYFILFFFYILNIHGWSVYCCQLNVTYVYYTCRKLTWESFLHTGLCTPTYLCTHTQSILLYCHPVSFYHLSFLAVGLTLNTIHRENKREIFHRQTLACSVERILLLSVLLNAVSLTKGD